ncbi:hypothetical protein AB2B38_001950 [Balneola sp. MJW-20]|uniref:hypothetical protein n=1 Tax=Gracilimonas aurantiaca TaxID=3234185 RepID=UPI003466D4C7
MEHREYHPVIESYVCDYIDENLTGDELFAFQELLMNDSDLLRYVESVKIGKMLLEKLRVS